MLPFHAHNLICGIIGLYPFSAMAQTHAVTPSEAGVSVDALARFWGVTTLLRSAERFILPARPTMRPLVAIIGLNTPRGDKSASNGLLLNFDNVSG